MQIEVGGFVTYGVVTKNASYPVTYTITRPDGVVFQEVSSDPTFQFTVQYNEEGIHDTSVTAVSSDGSTYTDKFTELVVITHSEQVLGYIQMCDSIDGGCPDPCMFSVLSPQVSNYPMSYEGDSVVSNGVGVFLITSKGAEQLLSWDQLKLTQGLPEDLKYDHGATLICAFDSDLIFAMHHGILHIDVFTRVFGFIVVTEMINYTPSNINDTVSFGFGNDFSSIIYDPFSDYYKLIIRSKQHNCFDLEIRSVYSENIKYSVVSCNEITGSTDVSWIDTVRSYTYPAFCYSNTNLYKHNPITHSLDLFIGGIGESGDSIKFGTWISDGNYIILFKDSGPVGINA